MTDPKPQDTPALGKELRRHSRYACKLKITYTILSSNDATPFEYGVTRTINLSESGVCIRTEHDVAVPVLMQLNISIPVRPYHMLVLGKALWCRKAEDGHLHEVGVKFVGILPPNFKEMIMEFGPSLWGEAD